MLGTAAWHPFQQQFGCIRPGTHACARALLLGPPGLFSAQNVNEYRGNVTAHCLANGSWYTQACGPMGAELLPYRTWLKNGYTAGFVEIDARIFDSYAATIVKRSREMGASADGFFSGARAGGAQLGVGAQRRGQNSAHRLWRRRRRKSRTLCLPRVPQPPARGQVARAHVRHASRILQPRERLD